MSAHSLSLEELPEPVRRFFDERGFGPGDRIYLLKLKPLAAQALADAAADYSTDDTTSPAVIAALATRFARTRRTIIRRLQRLQLPGHNTAGTSSSEAGQ